MASPHPLIIPRHLIPALLLAHQGAMAAIAHDRTALTELEQCGATSGGHLTNAAADLVAVMTDPILVVSVEVTTPVEHIRSTLWGTDAEVVWGRPADHDTFELRRLDPLQAHLLLAQLTGLGHRPSPPFWGGVTVESATLTRALEVRPEEPDAAIRLLASSGVDDVWADRLLLAHDLIRAQWSVSSVWTGDPSGHRIAEIEVLDAGAAGYWRIERAGDRATYSVTSLEHVLAAFRHAVPISPSAAMG